MIDYLEALLPEEDGEELALELGRQGPLRRTETGGEAEDSVPERRDDGEGGVAAEAMDPAALWAPLAAKGQRALWLQETAGAGAAAETPEGPVPPAALEEMAAPGQGDGAAALLERLARARQTAAYGTGTGGGAVRLSVPQAGVSGGGGLELETLDRAVQRDARRYDGGFALF